MRLLDSLDNDVEDAADTLQRETIHADKVREKNNFFWMYMCVGCELLVILLLVITIVSKG
jgi:uncharacterized protein YlaI